MDTKEIIQNNEKISVLKETAEIYEYCKTFSDVFIPIKYDTEVFIEIFNCIYLKDISDLYVENIIKRSNWTHHTANTFFRTNQLLNFKCEFESVNRHDGVVRDEDGTVFLCAEWEIDEQSIFSEKGEINKLLNTCINLKTCDAFLFTYNTKMDIKEYVNKVYTQWNNGLLDDDFRLTLITAVFDNSKKSSVKILRGLRTFIIG
ncbi:MAG: hypothetical protein RSD53_01345, partial [Algoriella sp.]